MFRWSSLDNLLIEEQEDDPAIKSSAITLDNFGTIHEEAWNPEWQENSFPELDAEPANDQVTNPVANGKRHDLLSADDERRLATEMQQCFRHLQGLLVENESGRDTLTRHITSDLLAASQQQKTSAMTVSALDAVLTQSDLLEVLEFLNRNQSGDQALELLEAQQRLNSLVQEVDLDRDWVLFCVQALSAPSAKTLCDRILDLRNQMISANIRLVYHIANKYREKGMEFDDLVQEGVLGLMRAAIKFDVEVGVRFSTYAYWWIQQAMRLALTKQRSLIRYPNNVTIQVNKLYAFTQSYQARNGCRPSEQEVMDSTGFGRKQVQDLGTLRNLCISADAPVFESSCVSLLDELSYEEGAQFDPVTYADQKQTQQRVRALLKELSPRESKIVAMKYGIGHRKRYSLNEIAPQVGVSRERVRQILDEVLKKFRGLDR